MKLYTKTHSSKRVAEIHLAKIKRRGGKATMKEVKGSYQIDYSFPDKKSSAKKTAEKKVSERTPTHKKRYDVISPDGISIRKGVPLFKSTKERDDYFKMWKKRFEHQGYYYSVIYGRIPLEKLAHFCQWIEI